MARKRSNKGSTARMEQILVATAATLPTGALVGSGTAYNIANGQVGVMSHDFGGTVAYGSFITNGTTGAQVDAVQVVQGTPMSGSIHLVDPFEVGDKGLVQSGIIYHNMIQSVATTTPKCPRHGAATLKSIATPVAASEYSVNVELMSVRKDRDWGDNDEVMTEIYKTPASLPADPDDLILSNLIHQFNQRSKIAAVSNSADFKGGSRDLVAIGISAAGGTGTAIAGIAIGDSVDIFTDGSTTVSLTMDGPMMSTIAQVCRDNSFVPATATIEVVDISTAGGATTSVDSMVVIGLPADLAAYADNIEQTQTSVKINAGGQFIATGSANIVQTPVLEGTGQGRKWTIEAERRYQSTVHTMQTHPFGEEFSKGKSYLSDAVWYSSHIVDYYDVEETLTGSLKTPKQLIILAAGDQPGVNSVAAGGQDLSATTIGTLFAAATTAGVDPWGLGIADGGFATALEANLGAWVESVNNNVELAGESTTGSIFDV